MGIKVIWPNGQALEFKDAGYYAYGPEHVSLYVEKGGKYVATVYPGHGAVIVGSDEKVVRHG